VKQISNIKCANHLRKSLKASKEGRIAKERVIIGRLFWAKSSLTRARIAGPKHAREDQRLQSHKGDLVWVKNFAEGSGVREKRISFK